MITSQILYNAIYKKIDRIPKTDPTFKRCATIQACLITLEALKRETKTKRKYDKMKLEIAKM